MPTRRALLTNHSTSPWVYARFHHLSLYDKCGTRSLMSHMFSFLPTDLSTLAIPYASVGWIGDGATEAFNFADLPCPPQSVMEQNWYMPRPGEPYRLLVLLPEQIKSSYADFATCVIGVPWVLDPPRPLTSATELIPNIKSPDEIASSTSETTLVVTDRADTGTSSISAGAIAGHALDTGPVETGGPISQYPNTPLTGNTPVGQTNPGYADPHKLSGEQMSALGMALHLGSDAGMEVIDRDPSGASASSSPTAFTIGQDRYQISPAGIKVNDLPIQSVSNPVTLSGGSAAIVHPNSGNLIVGQRIVSLPSWAFATLTRLDDHILPVGTTLPGGITATFLPIDTSQSAAHPGGRELQLSIHGEKLTPGGAAIIIPASLMPGNAQPTPMTLSLDSSYHLIYNPTVHQIPTAAPMPVSNQEKSNDKPNTSLKQPLTIATLDGQPVIALPNGQGISINGVILRPNDSKHPTKTSGGSKSDNVAEMILSGTTISLLGTSALIIDGTKTIPLNFPATATTESSRYGNDTCRMRENGFLTRPEISNSYRSNTIG